MIPADDIIIFRTLYDPTVYSPSTIERMSKHLLEIIQQVTENPNILLKDISLISSDERRQLESYNKTDAPYPSDSTLHELFEAQVEKTPNAIAVVCEDRSLTYQELNERANQLAHCLRDAGVGPDQIVGILLERSVEMMIAILGVLKA